MGVDTVSMSLYHHGKFDAAVPCKTAKLFSEKAKSVGTLCELVGYDGEKHGSFNYGRGDGLAYSDTLRRMDEFFVSFGWLRKTDGSGPSE